MSDIVLGVGASHSTLMNTHWHEVAGIDRAEQFRAGLAEANAAIVASEPDAVVIFGSNHFRGFWLDLMPAFTIGVGECTMSGESGTPEGPVEVDVALARHVLGSALAADFDLAFSTKLQVDHGISHAVQYLLDGIDVPIVPLVVNVFAPPLPSLARCDALGRVIGASIRADGAVKRVVVIGSGGLSHTLPFPAWDVPRTDDERFLVEAWTNGRENWRDYDPRRREIIRAAAPRTNAAFDEHVLDLVAAGRLAELGEWSDGALVDEGGNGAHELRAWILMAAVCGHAPGRTLVYSPMPEWLTGMGVALIDTPTTEECSA